MRENMDQKNSKYGSFLRSETVALLVLKVLFILLHDVEQ